jgi:hypothetical protein
MRKADLVNQISIKQVYQADVLVTLETMFKK